jgi:hypothetical protein
LNGGVGDDTLIWNNGDGSDTLDGDAGRDEVEVNGDPVAGDIFTLQSTGARVRLDRINLVGFSLDIGSSEALRVNGSGGNDEFAIGSVGALSLTAAGDAGNDAIAGGGSAETLLGGSGDDLISGGGGRDFASGEDGDDHVFVADGIAELAFGGPGDDVVIADAGLDILDGFETVNGAPVITPPPPVVVVPPADEPAPPPPAPIVDPPPQFLTPPESDGPPRRVSIGGGTLAVRASTAALRLSCPATSAGNCTGSLVLRTARRVKVGRRTAVLELARARYNLAPGTSRTLKLKLAKTTKRAADRRGRLSVIAIASTATAGSAAQSSRRLTLALGASARRR